MKRLVAVFTVLAILGFASAALAQDKPNNPREGTFTVTPEDYAQTTKYVIGFFLPGAASPVQTQDIGKPPIDASGLVTFTFNSQPLSFAYDYSAKVKAAAGAIESPWSDASNPFDRTPGKPGKPVIK
jgi:hypothetical protein